MSHNTPPIRPPSREEREKVQLPPIEADKKIKEKYDEATQQERPSSFFIVVWFTSLLRRIFNLFVFDKEHLSRKQRNILLDLKELKELLTTLIHEDMSQDPIFIKKLSEQWLLLVMEVESTEKSHELDPTKQHQLKTLKEALSDYRGGGEHPFSFYLERHVGEGWFPVPFLDMLRSLHEEAFRLPTHSHLKNWIALIDEIIS